MHPGPNYKCFFIREKLSRFAVVWKEVFIVELLIFGVYAAFRWNSYKFNWSGLERANNGGSFEVDIFLRFALLLNRCQKATILDVRPWIKKCKEDLRVWGEGVLEGPLDPSLIVFLHNHQFTILLSSILWAMRRHSPLPSSRKTGTNPSFNNLDCMARVVPDSACFLWWKWRCCRVWVLLLKNGTRCDTDSWCGQRRATNYTASIMAYAEGVDSFCVEEIAGVEIGVDDHAAEIECFVGEGNRIGRVTHDCLLIKLTSEPLPHPPLQKSP